MCKAQALSFPLLQANQDFGRAGKSFPIETSLPLTA
jgi:hypothetical protein